MTYYECRNGHLKRDFDNGSGVPPDARCVECGKPCSPCYEVKR